MRVNLESVHPKTSFNPASATQRILQQGDSLNSKAPESFCDRIVTFLKSLLDWLLCRSKKPEIKIEPPNPQKVYSSVIKGYLEELKLFPKIWDKGQLFIRVTIDGKEELHNLFFKENQSLESITNLLKDHFKKYQPKEGSSLSSFKISSSFVIHVPQKDYQLIGAWSVKEGVAKRSGSTSEFFTNYENMKKALEVSFPKEESDKFESKESYES